MKQATLVSATTGETLVATVEVADNFGTRFIGLMGRKTLAAGAGMVIEPCNGVHTWFMRFPIDVVYVDKDWQVIRVDEAMAPWRFGRPVRGAKRVIELPAGSAAEQGIGVGSALNLTANGSH